MMICAICMPKPPLASENLDFPCCTSEIQIALGPRGIFTNTPPHHIQPVYTYNKTRGLRKWPTSETIVLICNKLILGSTEIFEIEVRNSDLFGTSVPTCQECVHNKSEIYFI